MNHALSCLVLILALTAGCTKENAAFCCIDAADCAAQGVQEGGRLCTDGLSCVDNKCVASTCATSGCASTAPVCDVTTDVCIGCASSTECMRFPETDVCDMTTGSCVECASAMDCDATKPVCDAAVCRTCKLDSECPSGACADDGSCVAAANAVYLSPTGTDAVPCSQAQPCVGFQFAVQQTNNTRAHIVFAAGTYVATSVDVSAGRTTASSVWIHGHGAKVTSTESDGFVGLGIPTVMRDLELENTGGSALDVSTIATVERVKLSGPFGALVSRGVLTLRDVTASANTGCPIGLAGGSLRLDRGVLVGGRGGVCSSSPTVVDITNLLVSNTTGPGFDIPGVSGTIAFTTITDTGKGGTGAAGISCTQLNLQISSSIVWTPAQAGRPTVEGPCVVSSSIVGPTAFAGGTNINPVFVSATDFHLSGGSPARDMVNAGPMMDFEGDPRPRGVRFDLGADEAP